MPNETVPTKSEESFIAAISWHEEFMPVKTVWRRDVPRWRQALRHLDDCLENAPTTP